MHESFLLAGFGGQGVMFAGQLLAYAAMDEGLEVTWIPSYGPEMRGGTAHCYVVISDKAIGSPIVNNPDVVFAFNNPSFTKYEHVVAKDGLLASNASLITQKSERLDITHLPVPATAIADEIGNLRLMNVVMLGAVITTRPVVPIEAVMRALEEHLPAHRRDMLPDNFAALERGAAFANELFPVN
ncbi:MAG: 2-oxoacid:acceptor oxidoreductase family protein [Anaerolineaceae bacterium]|nr:2-oxoacid:acceptor oxidoreductase family protein [Anaerolineaceae bacterium]